MKTFYPGPVILESRNEVAERGWFMRLLIRLGNIMIGIAGVLFTILVPTSTVAFIVMLMVGNLYNLGYIDHALSFWSTYAALVPAWWFALALWLLVRITR